jgi:hypothetical protein
MADACPRQDCVPAALTLLLPMALGVPAAD